MSELGSTGSERSYIAMREKLFPLTLICRSSGIVSKEICKNVLQGLSNNLDERASVTVTAHGWRMVRDFRK